MTAAGRWSSKQRSTNEDTTMKNRPPLHRAAPFLLVLLCLHAAAAASLPGTPPPDAEPGEIAADRLFVAKDWQGAAEAYAGLAARLPAKPRFALRQGLALAADHQDAAAVAAFVDAVAHGMPAIAIGLQLPRLEARLGQDERALAALAALVGSGFGANGQLQQMALDPDLARVRTSPRYAAIFLAADQNAGPCLYAPEYRQFDFWIGEWDVTANGAPPSTPPSSSSIQLILDGCVIFENWQSSGYAGKSFNQYDAPAKKWRQFWVDSQGAYLEFEGVARDGNLYYTGDAPAAAGGPAMKHKLTFLRQGADEVRQLWEQSSDGGATWSVAFDGIYRRKNRGH